MTKRPAQENMTTPTPFFIDGNVIPRMTCNGPRGAIGASGVVISSVIILTAKHVTHDETGLERDCQAEGVGAKITRSTNDFAEMRVAAQSPFRAIISCDGFKEGGDYYAAGYALNLPRVTIQYLTGTSTKSDNNLTIARGSVTPGMSGGPIFDLRGRVVGIVNAYTDKGITRAYGTALKDTFICES